MVWFRGLNRLSIKDALPLEDEKCNKYYQIISEDETEFIVILFVNILSVCQ